MEPRRGDLAVAGSVILDTILRELDAEDITLCDLALREGLVLDYIHQHRTEIARADRYPDVRRRSVVELGERCNYFAQHAAQVSRLAVSMFDQTRGVHGLKDKEREWLEYAALLHDVGVHISYDKHHRHSYYLIKHGDLRGFDPQEIEVIGLIARYHRRAPPKKGHPGYGELPSDLRKAVKVLSSIVRLAEGLDRSHVQVLDSISLANRGDDYLMQLRTNGDAELELWAAGRHVEPFEDMLGKPVRFEVAPAPARSKRAPLRAAAPAKSASAVALARPSREPERAPSARAKRARPNPVWVESFRESIRRRTREGWSCRARHRSAPGGTTAGTTAAGWPRRIRRCRAAPAAAAAPRAAAARTARAPATS